MDPPSFIHIADRYFMILRFIPTFLGVKNPMVKFISPKNFIFYTLIGVTPDFLEEFFQVTNQEILENFKIYSQAFNG